MVFVVSLLVAFGGGEWCRMAPFCALSCSSDNVVAGRCESVVSPIDEDVVWFYINLGVPCGCSWANAVAMNDVANNAARQFLQYYNHQLLQLSVLL